MSQSTENTLKKRVIVPFPPTILTELELIAKAEDRTVPQQILRYAKMGLKHDQGKCQLEKAS